MSKRKTTAEFIEELNKLNSNIEVLGEYVSNKVKILCKCKVCENEWESVPSSLLGGCGCPKCGANKSGKARRKSKDDFVKELLEVNPNIEPLEDYTVGKDKILFACKVCGHTWKAIPSSVLRGRGCPNCAGHVKVTYSNFVARLYDIDNTIKVLTTETEYKDTNTHVDCECLTCGTRWKATPSNLLRNRSCPTCAYATRREKLTLSQEEFEEQVYANNKGIKIVSKYTRMHDKVTCECLTCGRTYETIAQDVARGAGCSVCEKARISAERKITNEEFLQRINDNVIVHNKYDGITTRMKCECKICGNTWETGAQNLLRGHGCRRCYFNSLINPDLTDEERLIKRSYPEYKEFVRNILARDKYTCQLTFGKKHDVVVHHLDGYDWCKEGRLDPNNAITINTDIHKEFHKKYGYGKNTKQQFVEFVNDLYKENRITHNAYERFMSERLK